MEENFLLDLLSCLEQNKSQKQINNDIKNIEKVINKLRLTATLAQGSSKKEINAYIKQLSNQLSTIKLKAQIDSKNLKSELDKALHNVSFKDIDALNINTNKSKLKIQKVISDTKSYAEKNPVSIGINFENRRNKLDNDLTAYLNRNSKINESSVLLNEANKVRELISAINDKKSLSEATDSFRLFKSEVASTGYNTQSTTDKIKSMLGHITKLGSLFSVTSLAVNSFTKSLGTLKDIDDILTEISKTSDMTAQELERLGDTSFKSASKYGKTASDYLTGIQEMSRSGFYGEKGTAMAEQSLLAQAAGDMSADLANNYILATNAAYKLNGEAEKINAVLDGQNSITNRNSVAMSDMAAAMSKAGTVASSYRMSVEDLSAMIGTIESVTKAEGGEVGNAIKAILINLQNVTSSKITDTLDAANASMTEFVNGTEKLRDPISILRDLAKTFNQLDEDDALRAEILTNIGGKHQASKLAALLQNMELFDKMLVDYSEGAGSAMEEAMKSANNWSGKINQIQNSWDSLVNSIISKNTVLSGLTFGDKLIQGAESFINTFGEIPVIMTTISTAMTALNKDFGITQIINPETKKLDLEGNLGIIDFSAIKKQKTHFEEANKAISGWNSKLLQGQTDIEKFEESVVQNNASLKAYLQTTSKDAPASLNGYKTYLQQTGQATEDLRLKTILLNTALTFLGGIAVQAVITGIANAFDKFNETVAESQEAVDSVNSKISDLKSQIEELNSLEYKSDFDKQKISQLEKELELQEKILEVEQKRLYQNQIGTKFSDYFDADSLITKQITEEDRYNKESFKYLSVRFKTDKSSLEEVETELSSLQERLNNGLAGHERFQVEGQIEKLTEKRNKLLEEQQSIEEQLIINSGEYLKNYQAAQEAVDSGLLTDSDLEKAQSMAEYWNQMYQDSSDIVTNIQKMGGRYDNTNDLLEEKFGGISRDDLVSLSDDDKRIALSFDSNNVIGFEELQQKIAETKSDIEELNATEVSITPTISSSVEQIARQLEPQFAKLGEAYQAIFTADGFTLDDVDNSMLEDIRKSFAEIEEEVGVAFDASVLNPFFDTLTDKSGSAEEQAGRVQEAFNNLATAYFYSTETLEQLNEETAASIEKQLEEMGVVNASEVVYDALNAKLEALALQKQFAAQTGYELVNATADEITSFLNHAGASEIARAYLFQLIAAEQVFGNTDLNTADKVAKLKELAAAYGQTAIAARIANMEKAAQDGHINIDYDRELASLQNEINSAINNVKIDFSGIGGGKSSAKSAGKEAGKSYKEGLEEELSNLNNVISGVTGRIDDQITVIKSQKEAALEAIDAEIDALNEQKAALEAQKKALEEERDARIEIIEQQKKQLELAIKNIDKQIKAKEKIIDGINDEIKAMQDANEQRKRAVDLQKAQYELERLQHQRTILQYSEDLGMHYVADTKNIRDAKDKVDDAKLEIEIANKQKQIDLIEKEIDLLNEKKDAINEQIDILDEQIDQIKEYYDAQIKAIDSQIESIDRQIEALQKQKVETESYFESMIEGLEKSKSKYEELTELVKQAELSAALKELGIDEEALINGSEEEFEKLKNAYMDVVFKLNEGNEGVLSSLQELSGYEGTAPSMLSESTDKLAEMNGQLDTSSQSISGVNTSLSDTASKTGEVSANVADMNANLSEVSTLMTEEQAAFDGLKLKISEIITAINEKAAAMQAGQAISTVAMAAEMVNLLMLKEKIVEVKESLDAINTTISTMDLTAVNNLTMSFQLLYDQLMLVSATLGAGMEGQEEGAVSGITSAIEALNNISLEDGIIAQFMNLKTAIDEVSSAIGGGGGESEGASGGKSSGGGSGAKSGGGQADGKGSKGEGESGGGNSLTGAIESMGETANEVIGEPGAEGDGTVIGEFGSMKTAVNDVTTAIGSGESEGGEGESSGGGEGEDSGNLIGSIVSLGETTQEELGESGGDGVIGKFEEFRDVVGEANEHVTGISEGLESIDGQEVECTIKVNIITSGALPGFATGTALDTMDLNSAEYKAKYGGKAHYEGTAKVTGDWGVRDAGKALVGELGQEIVVSSDGKWRTVGDNGAEFVNLQKGDIVFNHLQTQELLSKGNLVGRGKALADGTAYANGNAHEDGTYITPLEYIHMLQRKSIAKCAQANPNFSEKEAYEKLEKINANLEHSLKELTQPTHIIADNIKRMIEMGSNGGNTGNINNITNNRNVQPVVNHINVTCPGVTEQQVAERLGSVLGKELDKQFSGFHNYTDQMSRIR